MPETLAAETAHYLDLPYGPALAGAWHRLWARLLVAEHPTPAGKAEMGQEMAPRGAQGGGVGYDTSS
jgi:hypothetical protein